MSCPEIELKKAFDEFVLSVHISESQMRVRIRNDVSSYQLKTVMVTSKFIFITDLTQDEEIFQQICHKVIFLELQDSKGKGILEHKFHRD